MAITITVEGDEEHLKRIFNNINENRLHYKSIGIEIDDRIWLACGKDKRFNIYVNNDNIEHLEILSSAKHMIDDNITVKISTQQNNE